MEFKTVDFSVFPKKKEITEKDFIFDLLA